MPSAHKTIANVIKKRRQDIESQWASQLLTAAPSATGRISAEDVWSQAVKFLNVLTEATESGAEVSGAQWAPVREFLDDLSRSRAVAGFSSDETATFVFSMKRPLFDALRQEVGKD